jgi:hypothetical protein
MTTFKTSDQTAIEYKVQKRTENPLQYLDGYRKEKCHTILSQTRINEDTFTVQENGFVLTVCKAYNQHHHLILRPDDVWLAIAIQFGLYVDANSEALRHLFVAHEGKKELNVDGSRFDEMSVMMGNKMKENVKDPEVCDWILPGFSTTTENDTVVGSVVLMATMKKYFSYKFSLCCGIPEVTLLGTVQDWEEIRRRVGKLNSYGGNCIKWAGMLELITHEFVESSKGNVNLDFWSKVCHYSGGGSGPSYISGWITAFCVFNSDGKWQGNVEYSDDRHNPWGLMKLEDEKKVEKVENKFPNVCIDTSDIPCGYLTVDVKVDDNGHEFDTLMIAGHTGFDAVGVSISPKLTWHIAMKGDKTNANKDK